MRMVLRALMGSWMVLLLAVASCYPTIHQAVAHDLFHAHDHAHDHAHHDEDEGTDENECALCDWHLALVCTPPQPMVEESTLAVVSRMVVADTADAASRDGESVALRGPPVKA